MVRSLTLTPSFQTHYAPASSSSFRITVAVTASSNVDPKIFLYLAYPLQPDSGDYVAKFQCVCTPVDLVAQPADEPGEDADPAWFRLSSVTLDFRTRAAAMAAYEAINADAQRLLAALADQDRLTTLAPVTLTDGS